MDTSQSSTPQITASTARQILDGLVEHKVIAAIPAFGGEDGLILAVDRGRGRNRFVVLICDGDQVHVEHEDGYLDDRAAIERAATIAAFGLT